MNGASYSVYSSAVSYKSIQTDTTFYAKSYNTGREVMESSVVTRVLPKIERENPTFSISVDSEEYEKSHTATLTFADTGGAKLTATDYTVQYTWTSSTSTPSSYTKSMTVSVAESNQTTAQITKSDGTGLYYLHVKLNKKITDNATNECATTTLYIPFYMDNTAPVISQKKIETDPIALNSGATYSMDLLVYEEHSGLVTSDFVSSDIVVKVNGVESTATKTLTYKSVSNNYYEYNLTLTNITETGPITLTIKNESVPDYATNKCVETLLTLTQKSGSNFVGPYGDNVIPVITMTGEVTSVTVPTDKNLSGIVDKRYVNQYYTVKVPFRILDVGGQDFTNILEEKDFAVYTGTTKITPGQIVITLDSSSTVADSQTNLNIYQKDYTLTLTGLTLDGFMELVNAAGSITDLATNVNVETRSAPYTVHGGANVRVFVDNTKPQPTITKATTNKSNGIFFTSIEVFVRELGSGLLGDQVEAKDMGIKINDRVVNATTTLTPSSSNNYTTALGKDNAVNYTYTLLVSAIKETGTLRVQVKENQIIDKANNGNEAVSLDMPNGDDVIDNEGPLLGPITTNADANGEVYGKPVEVKITDCRDESGIASYEWQRSTDGTNFTTIWTDTSSLAESLLEDTLTEDRTYYYRVIVSDNWGNTTISPVVSVNYKNTLDAKPTLNLSKEQIDEALININGIIKSKNPIVKIEVNGREIPKSYYENNVKTNQYETTTTFTWPVTQNGIYKFTATDEKGNTVIGTINVNEFDFSAAIITPTKKDATALTPAQIIFTANEPVRIIDKNAHPGITYDTTDFSTRIIATVSPDVDFDETKIFDFENKGLTKVPVEVEPPLITKFAYLRFANPTTGNLNMNVLQIEALVKSARSAKVLTATGQVKSYYGFKTESVDTRISTEADINTATKLGSAAETYVLNEAGELVKLEKSIDSNVSANSNYTTGNASGMYQKTSGLFDNYSDRLLNDETIKYNKFRMTMVP